MIRYARAGLADFVGHSGRTLSACRCNLELHTISTRDGCGISIRFPPDDCAQIQQHVGKLPHRPLISIIMPAYQTPADVLRKAIASVREQLYPDWELCIADDASPSPHVEEICRAEAAADPRIKIIRRETNGHIWAASNSALSIATGEFVALMDHDDLLARHAFYHIAAVINHKPGVDIIYSDEDQIDASGRRRSPYFKTDWNPDLMLGHNMISHLTVYRRSLLEKVGNFREGYEGSQDYDLSLRAIDATTPDRIHHIPHVLYHWRRRYGPASFSEAWLDKCSDSARRAIADYLVRKGERGTVSAHPLIKNWHLVRHKLPSVPPLVSLLIPTRDKADILEKCVTGLLQHTDYKNFEILLLDNESREPATRRLFTELSKDDRVRIIPYDRPFNYSAINNFGVTRAKGSIIGLINNDIDVIDPNWLSEMVSLTSLPGAGAIGARLLYPDGRVQHGGVILGVGGVANHFNHLLPRKSSVISEEASCDRLSLRSPALVWWYGNPSLKKSTASMKSICRWLSMTLIFAFGFRRGAIAISGHRSSYTTWKARAVVPIRRRKRRPDLALR